jgi:hypothetical protein
MNVLDFHRLAVAPAVPIKCLDQGGLQPEQLDGANSPPYA